MIIIILIKLNIFKNYTIISEFLQISLNIKFVKHKDLEKELINVMFLKNDEKNGLSWVNQSKTVYSIDTVSMHSVSVNLKQILTTILVNFHNVYFIFKIHFYYLTIIRNTTYKL